MKYWDLKHKITTPLFFDYQIGGLYPDEPKNQINMGLSRLVKTGKLKRIKRGIYIFSELESQVDEFTLASVLYKPSYISLESALNNYGIIPDVAAGVTSVTPITTKKITTVRGVFLYSKINQELFFGFEKVLDQAGGRYYDVAFPEKALLDYVYVRKINNLTEQRVNLKLLNKKRLIQLGKFYPTWVTKTINEQYHN